MNGTNLFKIALRALSNNKMRAFLTMLGIIIGVASVITMLDRSGFETEYPATDFRHGLEHDYDSPRSRNEGWRTPGPVVNADTEIGKLRQAAG